MSFFGLAPDPAATERIHEDLGGPTIDADDGTYRSLGTAFRDLNATTLTHAQNLCVGLYRANPIANRVIRIYTSFIAGNGTTVKGLNPEVQAVLDEFTTSPRSRFDRNQRGYARDWLLFGEGFHPVTVDEMGNTTFGFIDPTTVPKVERSLLNNMILTTVYVKDPTSATAKPLEIIQLDTDPLSDSGGFLTGEVFAWPFDRIAAATRGTPLLLPNLDWLDAYDQVLWEMLEREKAMRAFFWDVAVEGGERQVQDAKEMFGTTPPRTGSVRFHTKSVEVKAEAPQLGHAESIQTATYQLRNIATGAGLAPHWLSEPEDANRSTAEAMDLPVLRNLVDIQYDWRYNLEDTYTFVIDQKVKAGLLPATLPLMAEDGTAGELHPSRELFTVEQPELESSKVEAAAAALAQVATAVVQLDMVDGIGRETIRRVVRGILPALGLPADEMPEDDADFDADLERRATDQAAEAYELLAS